MKYLKKFNEGDVNKITPHQMMTGSKYKITEPAYDDFDEGLQPETDIIEVVNKTRYGFILRNIEHDFTYERTFQHLMTCEIEEISTI